MKNLILSYSSGYSWDKIKVWNISAKNTNNDVCNLFLTPTQELIDACNEHNIQFSGFSVNSNKPPNNLRFLFQYKYLMSVKDRYSHVIVTDSRDVYFHHDPFPILNQIMSKTNKPIVCGSECILYKDEQWGNGNLNEGFGYVYDEYKTQEICNVGVLCGEVQAIAELCLMIFTMSFHNPASVSDQSSFNILMGTKLISDKVAITRPSDGLMVHLGTVGVQKFRDKLIEVPSWDESKIPNINNNVIPIIHQYDRINTNNWELLN